MRSYKRLTLLLVFALTITLLCALCLIACNSTALSSLIPSQKATSFVCIDVNPSIELVLDQDDNVMSVSGANEDAKVLLFQEDGIVGAHVNVAIENIASLAVEYKYLNSDNCTVDVSVVSADEDKQSIVLQNAISHFEKGATKSDSSLTLKFESAVNLALSQELAKIKEQYPSQEAVQSLSVEDFRLIKRAVEADDSLSITNAVNAKKETLISKVQRMQSTAEAKYDELYSEQERKARLVYENAVNTLEGELYIAYFAGKTLDLSNATDMLENLAKTKSALSYATASAYLTSLQLYKAGYSQYYRNPDYHTLKSNFEDVANALGVEVNNLIDGVGASEQNGEIYFEQNSFNDFVNKLYRNATNETRIQIYNAFESAIDTVFVVAEVSDEEIGFSVQDVESTIKSMKDTFVDNLQSSPLGGVVNDIVESTIQECTPTVDYKNLKSIENAISFLSSIANVALENMALTSEDIAQIENAKASVQSSIENALTIYNSAKDAAQQNAIERLSAQKEKRKAVVASL